LCLRGTRDERDEEDLHESIQGGFLRDESPAGNNARHAAPRTPIRRARHRREPRAQAIDICGARLEKSVDGPSRFAPISGTLKGEVREQRKAMPG
jgi:hypothetical protein